MPTAWSPLITDLKPAKSPEKIAGIEPLLDRMVDAYGQAAVAGLLGVDDSAVAHWRSGKRNITASMKTRILELHDVLSRVHQVFNPLLASRWLTGHEPLLGGARPIDVLAQRGAAPVIDALDALVAGGFA